MLKPGIYKNHNGAMLEVVRPIINNIAWYYTLGGIWEARSKPGLFGGRDIYLVTEQSMRDSGYQPCEEET